MDEQPNTQPNDDETPLDVVIPDSPEGLVTPRFYRKQAQHAMLHALHESKGRSGLSPEEKIEQVKRMQEYLSEALSATTMALELMEADAK